ncbi:tRNA (adenosine(37)-N6)-threonylcarbamoyltransferase complex dimerization subunit type 1 TsaB [Neisseria leonii]|uniref:tRNA (Adenosine(37)-N6)-threonylcarbamoyltransferase complex dimerization subunit type 1 TsaB n=1 Tax=Neisseria leonii TaxID=2995413 RepID=A0A9X4IET4_9NEIS|nr:tRNA (adenosine(37)-N6)-threonylcarbamoyltransferase complex dimerization subunit type 1 TsaB [Neisseria sp. 51.81]MDD9328542.1 tRNA (adenosine(37)-N6)-threonylcarbamoyltransferase complex dimerization subunit type 1 TsaB [Neisseria sp. 51.81]
MSVDFSRPLLAIDTGTPFLSLALSAHGQTLLFHEAAANRQSEQILPQIGRLLAEADCRTADLAAIVYAQGPGAFTGLRIGAGVAQGLAAPHGLPLIGIPGLDAVAYQIRAPLVLAATDARMGEVFYAWFDTENGRRLSPYRVGPADTVEPPQAGSVCGIGNAFALPEPPPFAGRADMPTAAGYLNLARSGAYPVQTAAQADLLYVRDKIALTAAEQAAAKRAASC